MKLLCISNGHGEDVIAVQIMRQLQQQAAPPEIAALPIVGEGRAYLRSGIPLIGPVQSMPSGGFINTDRRQLLRDLQGGLLQLTQKQLQAIRVWAKQGGMILAVGDIVPLLFAWLSVASYAFVATAKSEYYVRDETGPLPGIWWRQPYERWIGSVYLPWEQWLMSHRRCKAVFPRDRLTTEVLQQRAIPAFDLGNPMMDGLEPDSSFINAKAKETQPSLTIVLLPGSRAPEAYNNWQQILTAIAGFMRQSNPMSFRQASPTAPLRVSAEASTVSSAEPRSRDAKSILFLGAIDPGLHLEPLGKTLHSQGWQLSARDLRPELRSRAQAEGLQPSQAETVFNSTERIFIQGDATLLLTQHGFNNCLHQADLAIAMAGTATEQFVGLGKPAIILPGQGPQFTPAFAEAQTRLLGPSVTLVDQPTHVADVIKDLLSDPSHLALIAENGLRRMGKPGAASRIAACLMEQLM